MKPIYIYLVHKNVKFITLGSPSYKSFYPGNTVNLYYK